LYLHFKLKTVIFNSFNSDRWEAVYFGVENELEKDLLEVSTPPTAHLLLEYYENENFRIARDSGFRQGPQNLYLLADAFIIYSAFRRLLCPYKNTFLI
jgi:hypothetical protein